MTLQGETAWIHLMMAWYFIVLGGLAVVIALFLKRGVWGTLRRWVDVQLFPLRHHLE
jgi:hypothetical protein